MNRELNAMEENENENKRIKIDINEWFTVCDAEEKIQVIFPTENFAHWYLEKCGWAGWEIRRVCKNENGLFFLEEKRGDADDEHQQTET
jgi:hypothetical protein